MQTTLKQQFTILRPETAEALVRPALELIVFVDATRAEVVPRMVNFWRVFQNTFGAELRWYKTNVMKSCKRVPTEGAVKQIEVMGSDRRALGAYLFGLEQHSGSTASDFDVPALDFFSQENLLDPEGPVHRMYLRACVPIETAGTPEMVVDFAKAALAELPFLSGYCGYSYYWNTGSSEAERELARVNRSWLLRYPGLGYGKPLALFGFLDEGLLGVNWLTFIGRELMDRIGTAKKLAELVAPSATISPLGKGLLVRAGKVPQLGDVNRNQGLPEYARVARALYALRLPPDSIENLHVIGLDGDDVVSWYLRFFDAKA